VLSGIEALDNLIGPIRRKQLGILAGRPGMGKSALAAGYGRGAAHRGHGVLLISLEMSAEELGARIASDETFDGKGQPVPYALIERGLQRREDIRRVQEARDRIAQIPLEIIDIGQATTGRVNALVRRWKRRMAARGVELELVVIDYLQKLRPNHKTRDRIEAVTEISQDLKSIAKDNDVAVLALSQLSRAVEQRADHRPQLSDLRESGQIEQDADLVLFLYRQQYYLEQLEPREEAGEERRKWEAAMEVCRGLLEFICAKRRQGQTGKAMGRFYGALGAVRG
jgi:replicative DNA helicase